MLQRGVDMSGQVVINEESFKEKPETNADLLKEKQSISKKEGRKLDRIENKGISLFTAIIISVLSSVLSVVIYHYFFAVKIAIIDLSGYLLSLRDLYVSQKISDEELKARVDAFVDVIKQNEGKYIILNAESVLGRNRNLVVLQPPPLPVDTYPDISQRLREMLKR